MAQSILSIHENILRFLLAYRSEQQNDLRFMPRSSNRQQRLERGYWFIGNAQYLAVSFWDSRDWKQRLHNLSFVVQQDGKAEVCFSATDSAQKALIFEQWVQQLGGYVQEDGLAKWRKTYAGTHYLENLQHFLEVEYPLVERLREQTDLEVLPPIQADDFSKRIGRIERYRNRLRTADMPVEEPLHDYEANQQLSIPSPNLLLYGPPGTGKTFKAMQLAAALVESPVGVDRIEDLLLQYDADDAYRRIFHESLQKRIHFITFHSSYSYEDFIGGLQPQEQGGALSFQWKSGIFLRACAAAYHLAQNGHISKEAIGEEEVQHYLDYCAKHQFDNRELPDFREAPRVVLLIDEINRANLARVFGELLTLLEADKRLHAPQELVVTLPNGRQFGVPANLVVLGTLNTADKSIALLDLALRRRFHFIPLYPRYDLPKLQHAKILRQLNKSLQRYKGADFQIGHSYFMAEEQLDLERLFNQQIIPLLYEYFMHDTERIGQTLGSLQTFMAEEELQFFQDEATGQWRC